jgi:hypothetical protein
MTGLNGYLGHDAIRLNLSAENIASESSRKAAGSNKATEGFRDSAIDGDGDLAPFNFCLFDNCSLILSTKPKTALSLRINSEPSTTSLALIQNRSNYPVSSCTP